MCFPYTPSFSIRSWTLFDSPLPSTFPQLNIPFVPNLTLIGTVDTHNNNNCNSSCQISLSFSRSLHSHDLFLSLSLSSTHTLSLSLSLSLFNTHTHTLFLSLCYFEWQKKSEPNFKNWSPFFIFRNRGLGTLYLKKKMRSTKLLATAWIDQQQLVQLKRPIIIISNFCKNDHKCFNYQFRLASRYTGTSIVKLLAVAWQLQKYWIRMYITYLHYIVVKMYCLFEKTENKLKRGREWPLIF